jgi:glycogen operon protein
MLLVLNAHHDLVRFTLPAQAGGSEWRLLIDTNMPEKNDEQGFKSGDAYGVTARSLLLFALA